MMKISILILTLDCISGDQLAGLVNSRVKDAQCNLVCGHLESGTDYSKCRRLCSEHDATRQQLCLLPTCDLACQTACAPPNQVKQPILDFSLDGCTLDWMTTDGTGSRSILTGQDFWGRYTVLHEGAGTDQFTVEAENSGKWRQFVLFVIGKAGLEARETLNLEKLVQCSQPSLPEAQPITDTHSWVIMGSALSLVIITLLVLVMVLLNRCSSTKRSDSSASLPTISTISLSCEAKTFFETKNCQSFEDYHIYEDVSFSSFGAMASQKTHLNSFV